MDDALGPCPVCGTKNPENTGYGVWVCTNTECHFQSLTRHWNLMRRKMTREEAEKMREDVWGARRDMERAAVKSHDAKYCAALNQYTAAMRVIVDALVGDKP